MPTSVMMIMLMCIRKSISIFTGLEMACAVSFYLATRTTASCSPGMLILPENWIDPNDMGKKVS